MYAVVTAETAESVGVSGKGEADAEAGGGRLLPNGGKDGVRVLEDGDADREERTLGTGGTGGDEEVFWAESFNRCEPDELRGHRGENCRRVRKQRRCEGRTVG